MFLSNKRYLSISINDAVIKVAQVTSSGVVEKVARIILVDVTADDQVKALKTLLNGFDRKAAVVCTIPASAATAKNIEVPSADPQEIKSIINLQASRHTPYSREEVLISYVSLGAGSASNTKILLVIAHRNVVKDRVAVLEKAGLNVDSVVFAPEAMARFYAKALNLKKDAPVAGVIDVSLNATNYISVFRGSLGFARHIPVGIKSLLESSEAPAKLTDEFNKSISAFVNEDVGVPPEAYLLTANQEVVRNAVPALEEGASVKFSVSSFTNFIKGSVALKKKLEKDFGDDSFLDVISPVSFLGKLEVNLMPEEMMLKKTVERQSQEATRTGVSVVILMLLVGGIIMSKIYFKDTFLNKNLREQYASQHKEAATLQEKIAKMKIIKDYLQDRSVSLDAIHELYSVTPTSIYLNAISMDEEGVITLEGVSDSMSQVFSYVKALDDSPMFKGVKTKSTATKKDRGKDVATFEITCSLESSPSKE